MTLEEATRALRDEGAMDPARKRALRERVLATPRKRPLRAVRWVMPIAAVLAAASVWASVSRERHHASAPTAAPPVAATAIATVVVPVAPIASVVTIPELPAIASSAPVQLAPHVTTKLDDGERRALRAYREAERLQFDDKDYARALGAWDRYMPLAGKSPLLVDAKWQRALCLVRLERSDEAREALEPFARGELGAYRQGEAQTLLGTLR